MKAEVLKLFSSFSGPVLGAQHALKSLNANGKPVTDLTDTEERGCGLPDFSPYPSRVPWHTGTRGFFSRVFPRYGNYCGPNWSSGRESGSLVWDKAPVDALDHCCYRHDIGYDSHNQADLHRADIVFLNCLERMRSRGQKSGNSPLSEPYRNLYIFGLRNFLIPYRKFLLQRLDQKTRRRFTVEEIVGKDRSQPVS